MKKDSHIIDIFEQISECSYSIEKGLSRDQFKQICYNFFEWLKKNDTKNYTSPNNYNIDKYVNYLRNTKELKNNTIRKYLITIKKLFKFLNDKNMYINILNTYSIPPFEPSKKYALTIEQSIILRNNINKNTLIGLRNSAIIDLMLTCGLRSNEIRKLRIKDVNDQTMFLLRKGKKDRKEYPISKTSVNAISVYLLELFQKKRIELKDDDYLFFSLSNNKKTELKTIGTIVKNELKKAGFEKKGLTAHSLRHTFAHIAHISRVSIFDISLALGHKSIKTTQIYLESIEESMRRNPAFDVVSRKLDGENIKTLEN